MAEMVSLHGQVAVVTGASRGLGRHIALELARKGARVALTARSESELQRAAEECGNDAFAVVLDVTQWDSVDRGIAAIRERLGAIDILVNNAGVGWYKPLDQWSIAEIDLTLDVNLRGTMYMTKAVLPEMQSRHRGQILNVASDLARRTIPNMAPYVAAKFGVLGFSGALLREVKSSGVKVMTVTPGIVDTFFNGGTEGSKEESWSLRPEFLARTIVEMLELPAHWVMDELSIHAMGQDF